MPASSCCNSLEGYTCSHLPVYECWPTSQDYSWTQRETWEGSECCLTNVSENVYFIYEWSKQQISSELVMPWAENGSNGGSTCCCSCGTFVCAMHVFIKESINHQLVMKTRHQRVWTQLELLCELAHQLIGGYWFKRKREHGDQPMTEGLTQWPTELAKRRICKQCAKKKIRHEVMRAMWGQLVYYLFQGIPSAWMIILIQ